MTHIVLSIALYSLIPLVLIGIIYWYKKQHLNSEDCQTVQVELYRQTTYLIGELKMELDELRGALALAQSEAEALKAVNVDLTSKLVVASKVPDDIAAQANQLVSTLAPS